MQGEWGGKREKGKGKSPLHLPHKGEWVMSEKVCKILLVLALMLGVPQA